MSGSKLLLDSNIAIYLSNQSLTIEQIAKSGDLLCVSIITCMEVKGYAFSDLAEEQFVNKLFDSLQQLPITTTIANRVITYRKLRKIKLPDAIILATARENGCQLVTRNVEDFIGLDSEVRINNPFSE